MKKKGFTLIELLAVIVILAIIALIATPLVLNIIERARVGAAMASASGYIDSVKNQITLNLMEGNSELNDNTFTVRDLTNMGVEVSGEKPTEDSWVKIENSNITEYSLQFGAYLVTYNETDKVRVEKNGEVVSNPTPTEPEPTDVEITFDIESAASDTVTIIGGSEAVTATTDATGHGTVTMTIPVAGGTYTFTSSVAKDTETGTNAYSKEVNLTSSTTNVKVMPDGAIYWAGNEINQYEIWKDVQRPDGTYQKSANNLYFYSGNYTYHGAFSTTTTIDTTNYASLKMLYSLTNSRNDATGYAFLKLTSSRANDNWGQSGGNVAFYLSNSNIASIDVSTKNESYYTSIEVADTYSNYPNSVTLMVYQIWFE